MPPDKQRKKELLKRFKRDELAGARQKMCLQSEELQDLRSFLGRRVVVVGCEAGKVVVKGCDYTLRWTRDWIRGKELDAERVLASLGDFGGFCDCGVLFNVTDDKFGWE